LRKIDITFLQIAGHRTGDGLSINNVDIRGLFLE
jgi:hypothetical protein